MSEYKTIDDLINSHDADIIDLVDRAKHLRMQLIRGEISQAEFDELFEDLKRIDYIDDHMTNFLVIKKLKNVLDVVQTIKAWAP